MLLVVPLRVPLTFAENAVSEVSDPDTNPVESEHPRRAPFTLIVVGLLPERLSGGVMVTDPENDPQWTVSV